MRYLEGLNPEQAEAVAHGDGPLRIVAGAGTGKTHTLTRRIVGLVAQGCAEPSQILALTFTTKAAEELEERIGAAIRELRGNEDERVDIDTYHAFGGRIVAEHGLLLGLPPEPLVLTPPESWILLWRALDEIEFQYIDLLYLRGINHMRSPLYTTISLGSRLRDELATLTDLDALLETMPPGDERGVLADHARALAVYERKKREAGAIDYGDQIALACELLERPEIAALYRARYRYLLVDEFQDTNYAQSVLVNRLTGDPGGNVCVVGDANQAIYAFRGAAPDNLDRFATSEFPSTRTVALRQNFRSAQAILDVANAIWGDAPGEFRGNLVAANGARGDAPELVECARLEDEIAFIAAEITAITGAGRKHKDIAVIVRKNAMKMAIYQGLRERRIPAEAIGGSSLFETPEVRELISYLRAIGDPADAPSLAHVLCAEQWGLDERALYDLARARQKDEPLIACARRIAANGDGLPAVTACVTALDRLIARSYRVSLTRLLDEIIALRRGGYDQIEIANVQRFQGIVRAFAESRVERPTLADLLAYLDLLLMAGPDDEAAGEVDLGEADTVKIMTAHAAKGLEWPVVFVAGTNKNDFVTSTRNTDALPAELAHPAPGRPLRADFPPGEAGKASYDKALEVWRKLHHALEEQRVLYVALTRARERLLITWSRAHPKRKRESVLLPTMEPAVELCRQVQAPQTAAATPGVSTFREIAVSILLGLETHLDDEHGKGIERRLVPAWERAGGDPAVARAAVERFLSERERLREQIDAIRTLEERARVAEVTNAPIGAMSYTQLETFRACPHRYYLRYALGLPGLPDRRSVSIGLAFHHAVAAEAERRRAGLDVSPGFVRDLYAQDPNLTELEPAGPPVSGDAELDPIASYLASIDACAEPLLIEEAFSLRLGEATLRGVIDRVQRLPDGTVEVVDYKTDRRVRTAEEVRAGWQLPIYLLACRDVFTEIQPAPLQATMFFVRRGERVTVQYSPDELDAIRDELSREATRLRTARPGDHRSSATTCRHCEYRLTCSHRAPSP